MAAPIVFKFLSPESFVFFSTRQLFRKKILLLQRNSTDDRFRGIRLLCYQRKNIFPSLTLHNINNNINVDTSITGVNNINVLKFRSSVSTSTARSETRTARTSRLNNFNPYLNPHVFASTSNSTAKTSLSSYESGFGTKFGKERMISSKIPVALFGIVTLAALKSEEEEEQEKEDAIRQKIAQAILAERQGEIGKAEKLYHTALFKAKQDDNSRATMYIYNKMANFCFRHNKHWKAENLFKELLKLFLAKGIADDDPAVIEASLKIAQIYEAQFRYTEARVGYEWCVSQSEKRLKSLTDTEDVPQEKLDNVYALLGMCLGTTGRFFLIQRELQDAESMFSRALSLCLKELANDGKPHPQASVILNDLGTVYDLQKSYDKAVECFEKAINLSHDAPEDIPVMICNLASVELHRGDKKKAGELYDRALKLAKKHCDEDTVTSIKIAMDKMKRES